MWLTQANNPLAEKIARIMAEGRYDEVYDESPEFHYAIAAALRATTEEQTLRGLIATFAGTAKSQQALLAHAVELAKFQPPPVFIVKEVDKPATG